MPQIIEDKDNNIESEAKGEDNEHVVKKNVPSNQNASDDSKVDKLNDDTTEILHLLKQIQEDQLKDRKSFNNQTQESKECIIALTNSNNKMVAELEAMKTTVRQLEDKKMNGSKLKESD